MTNIEAVEYFKKASSCNKSTNDDCRNKCCKSCEYDYDVALADDVVKLAILALEKQIPKKPQRCKEKFSNALYYRCPTCEGLVDESYCKWCGQKIDW